MKSTNESAVSPAISAWADGPPPLYGTWVILMPAMFIISSVAMWLVAPTPAVEKEIALGRALARAVSSLTVFTGSDGCTERICGLIATSEIGANDFSLS